jgi:signal transduction histidine kinase
VETLDEDREFEPIDLSRVLRKEVRSLQESHPTVEVATDVEPAITVRADRLLQQVFSNLLGNAVAHNDADDLSITVRAWRDGSWATVEIDDDGRGISPEDRERLFELGEEGADSDGDGIGLYLVSRPAEIYGGDGDVEESPAVGARFRVRLPVKTD